VGVVGIGISGPLAVVVAKGVGVVGIGKVALGGSVQALGDGVQPGGGPEGDGSD